MRKIDFQKTTSTFKSQVESLKGFLEESKMSMKAKDSYISNCYEYGIISLYKSFEMFMYRTILGCINHNSSYVSEHYKVDFGRHISDEMCDFILTKGGYFDFRGTDGLIKICKHHIGDMYGIVDIIKKDEYAKAIDKLVALRNYAAHNSNSSKERAKAVLKLKRIPPIGSYLKKHKTVEEIADKLCKLADEIAVATR